MIQAQTRNQVLQGIQQFGAAPGARKMMDREEEAAQHALETGLYSTYRNNDGQDCSRVGPSSKCFCGHHFSEHTFVTKKAVYPSCLACKCSAFAFVPQRPEEVGEWWLVRRKGFNVHTWRAKCRCGHSHDEHDPVRKRCRCGCGMFQSNFACLACDKKWEDHETVFETTQERLMGGRTVGEDFRPLANDKEVQDLVFPAGGSSKAPDKLNRLRPAQVPSHLAEKSVQIMHTSSGGVLADQEVVNRYGKVANPPREWLYMGGSTESGSEARALGGGDGSLGFGASPVDTGARGQYGNLGSGVGARASPTSTSRADTRAAGQPAALGVSSTARSRGAAARAVPTTQYSTQAPKALASGFKPVYD